MAIRTYGIRRAVAELRFPDNLHVADHSLAIGRGTSGLCVFFIRLTLQLSEHATARVQLSFGDCDPLVRRHERVVETALQIRLATAVLRSRLRRILPCRIDVEPCGFSRCKMPAMASAGHESESKHLLEAQLRATLDVIPAYAWYAAPSGALTFVNKRHSDYLGLPKDHPLRFGIDVGAEWDSHVHLLHPDDHAEMRRAWSHCLRTSSAGEVSFRVRNAEGGYRWFLSQVEPLRASDGTLLYWIGVTLDIEERKQAEFYLAEGQRLAHVGSWAFNAAGFDYWSSELFRIYGLDPSGSPPTVEEYLALVHPEDRRCVHQRKDCQWPHAQVQRHFRGRPVASRRLVGERVYVARPQKHPHHGEALQPVGEDPAGRLGSRTYACARRKGIGMVTGGSSRQGRLFQ